MKYAKNIALVVGGIVIGLSVSLAPNIEAATSKLLGGKVAKIVTVKKDGQVIGEGGIINGTTYLPVRTVVGSINGIEVGSVSSSEVNLVTTNEVQTEKAKQEEEMMKLETEENNNKINDLRASIRDIEKQIHEAKFSINIEQSTSYKTSKIYVDNYESGKGGSMREEDYNYYKAEVTRMNKEKEEAVASLPELEKELADLEAQLAALK